MLSAVSAVHIQVHIKDELNCIMADRSNWLKEGLCCVVTMLKNEITKGCPEYVSYVVNVSKCCYLLSDNIFFCQTFFSQFFSGRGESGKGDSVRETMI